MQRLTKRQDFVALRKGRKAHGATLTLQALRRPKGKTDGDPQALLARVGFTVTKREGGSVERNRIRRRLRAAAQRLAGRERPDYDYVVVGRRAALAASFAALVHDLSQAFDTVHRPPPKPSSGAPARQTKDTLPEGDKARS